MLYANYSKDLLHTVMAENSMSKKEAHELICNLYRGEYADIEQWIEEFSVEADLDREYIEDCMLRYGSAYYVDAPNGNIYVFCN